MESRKQTRHANTAHKSLRHSRATRGLIASDNKLNQTNKLLQSIPGVGDQLATHMIVYTHCFTHFATWRQFAVKHDRELKQFYQRKKAEGKNAMLVLNAVRNKLLSRMFAVIERGTPYVQLSKHAA